MSVKDGGKPSSFFNLSKKQQGGHCMGRSAILEQEINKRIAVDEKSGSVIPNWSPNNVRRLIIGIDFAIIQYFVTGGKYQRLIEVVDYRKGLEEDYENLTNPTYKYKSILQVLTNGRICSSVEEIIFCKKGYHPTLLGMDRAVINNQKFDRFVRLQRIYDVDTDVRSLMEYVIESTDGLVSVYDKVEKSNIRATIYQSLRGTEAYKYTSLRPKYYRMDEEVLKRYFDRVRSEQEEKERFDKLSEMENRLEGEKLEKGGVMLNKSLIYVEPVRALAREANRVFETCSTISKFEWGKHCLEANVEKAVRGRFSVDDKKRYALIDFDKLGNFSERTQGNSTLVTSAKDTLVHYLGSTSYKPPAKDDSFLSYELSLKEIKKASMKIISYIADIAFVTFVLYLSRNGAEYAKDYLERLNNLPKQITYTKNTVEYCNRVTETEVAKKVLDSIGAERVAEEEFSLQQRFDQATALLRSLAKMNMVVMEGK